MWSRPWPLEGSVQRVVEKRRPLDGVEVVARHEWEALGDGEEAGRLRDGGESLLEVGAVHDAGERAERRVVGSRSERRPRITAAPAIAPGAAAVTPSTNPFTCRFFATRWKCGATRTTTRYTGRKTPIAARVAPVSPPTR